MSSMTSEAITQEGGEHQLLPRRHPKSSLLVNFFKENNASRKLTS